jgi:ubiquinone biosynthesis accessory factor UbiJ
MIKQYSLNALQKAMQHALALDPAMPDKIKALSPKVLQIVIRPLDIYFFMQFTPAGIILLPEYEKTPDTVIHSSPLGLIRLSLLPASKVRSLFNDQIRITGDTALGQAVKQLFDDLDIDWEAHLAHFTGDVVAHQMGRFVRRGQQLKQSLHTSLQQNLGEYIQEEASLSPPREAVADFMNDVDALALDVERLTAHINHYVARHETS